jgi:hypothetical protein
MARLECVEVMLVSTSVLSVFIMAKSLLSAAQMAFVMCFSADVIFHAFIARITRSAATGVK